MVVPQHIPTMSKVNVLPMMECVVNTCKRQKCTPSENCTQSRENKLRNLESGIKTEMGGDMVIPLQNCEKMKKYYLVLTIYISGAREAQCQIWQHHCN